VSGSPSAASPRAAEASAAADASKLLHLTLTKRQPSYEELVAGLPTVAERMVAGNVVVDTLDHEDHTFCGVMFDVAAVSNGVPMMFVEIQSVSVRGALGPVSVYSTPRSYEGKHRSARGWERVFGATDLPRSMRRYTELVFAKPIRLAAGMSCGLYVHSTLPGDEAIVYDNARDEVTYADAAIRVLSGIAHVSNVPFNPQGAWGHAWRPRRAFVGRVRYGVKLLLWRPDVHFRFPEPFGEAVRHLLMCQLRRRDSREAALFGAVPVAVVYKILQYLSWDDFGAGSRAGALEADEVDEEADEEEGEDEGEGEGEEEGEAEDGDEDHGGGLEAFLRAAGFGDVARDFAARLVRDASGRFVRRNAPGGR